MATLFWGDHGIAHRQIIPVGFKAKGLLFMGVIIERPRSRGSSQGLSYFFWLTLKMAIQAFSCLLSASYSLTGRTFS